MKKKTNHDSSDSLSVYPFNIDVPNQRKGVKNLYHQMLSGFQGPLTAATQRPLRLLPQWKNCWTSTSTMPKIFCLKIQAERRSDFTQFLPKSLQFQPLSLPDVGSDAFASGCQWDRRSIAEKSHAYSCAIEVTSHFFDSGILRLAVVTCN